MIKSNQTNDYKLMLKRLKSARVEAGLSQKEVANILKNHQSYVSKIESGERRIDIIEIKKLSVIYKKTIDYFVS